MTQEEEVQALLNEIKTTRQIVEKQGDEARAVVGTLEPVLMEISQKLGLDSTGKLSPGAWDKLQDDVKVSVHASLMGIRDLLTKLTKGEAEGPDDPQSIMFKAYASNGCVWGMFLGAVVGTVVLIWGIYRYWQTATGPQASEADVLRMVILMGALGGMLHWTSSFAKFVGNRQLLRSWIPYYILMPFEGASLAPLVYLLLRVGVLAPAVQTGSQGPVGLNLFGLYGFAGLTGLFSKQAIDMLADVFKIIFKKIQAKDPLEPTEGKQAAGGKPAGSGRTP
jgi:uncharacterized membrane protein